MGWNFHSSVYALVAGSQRIHYRKGENKKKKKLYSGETWNVNIVRDKVKKKKIAPKAKAEMSLPREHNRKITGMAVV